MTDEKVRTVQWQPKDAPIPEGAVDHGLGPAHHGAHSRLIEFRTETTLEDRPAPDMIYLVRDHSGAEARIHIVENGRSTTWPLTPDQLLRLAADATNYLLTGKR